MKGIVIVSKFCTKILSAGKADAITVFPFIFIRNKKLKSDQVLLNHENIHIQQAIELLVIPFYLWYILEFLIRLILYRKFDQAYLNISFEREAYKNEKDFNYLKNRRYLSFLKFI